MACKTVIVPFWATLLVLSTVVAQDRASTIETETQRLREQTIYVPYDKLRQTFEKQGRGVFLPYEKFHELWKAARDRKPLPRQSLPPVDAVITDIDNQAHVENDVLRVVAVLRIDLLGKGWIEVPIRLGDAALLSATIDDQPALLVADQGVGQKLLVKKDDDLPRQVELRLEYAKTINKAPGRNSVAFQAPLAPVNRWHIRIPESGVKVNVHPMLAVTEVPTDRIAQTGRDTDGSGGADQLTGGPGSPSDDVKTDASDGQETVVLAFVGAAPLVSIDWTPKAGAASGLDALVSVQTEQEIMILESASRTRTRLAYEVSRSELEQLKIEVPTDQKVVGVSDANVRQWNVQPNGEVQTITVRLFQPAGSHQSVTVELEQFSSDSGGQLRVPEVKAVDAQRQRGIIVARVADGLRAEPVRHAGLSQLDASEIPAHMKTPPWALSYRFAALPIDLVLSIEKVEPRIDVDHLVEVFLEPQKLTLDLLAKFNIQRAGVFELHFDVPDGFEVRRVSGHSSANGTEVSVDSYVLDDTGDGSSRLAVILSSKALGEIALLVELERPLNDLNLLSPTGESSLFTLVPPRATEKSVRQSAGRMVVYAPVSLRVAVESSDGLRTISFEEAFRDFGSQREKRFPNLKPVQAFAFSAESASAQLNARRRQPQVTVRQLLIARIDPGVVKYEATFSFDVQYSGVKSLRIDVPAELAIQIRNESRSLRESTMTPPPDDIAEGYVAWQLMGESEMLGSTQCILTWETPIEELGIGQSVDLTVPRLIPRDVDRADGQIVLVKAETIDVQPNGTPQGLDPIDPQHDLMAPVEDAAAALEFHDQWNLTLTATRYELQMLKQTSIEQALLRMVITRSDRVSVQALYRMRSNRQRLRIHLPGEVVSRGIEFDSNPLRINGRRVTLERGDDNRTYFVPLVGHGSNEPFVLELRYTAPGGAGRLSYPEFPDDPAIQKVNLIAYVPRERTYLGKRGPWTDESTRPDFAPFSPNRTRPVDVKQLIDSITSGISIQGNPAEEFPTDGRPLLFSTLRPLSAERGAIRLATLNTRWLHGLVFGVVALAGVLLLRRPAVDRLVVICALVALFLAAGVFVPTITNAVLNQTFTLALAIVGLIWLAAFSMHTLPKLSKVNLKGPRRPGQKAVAQSVEAAAEASDGEPTSHSGELATEEPTDQEGGPHNA